MEKICSFFIKMMTYYDQYVINDKRLMIVGLVMAAWTFTLLKMSVTFAMMTVAAISVGLFLTDRTHRLTIAFPTTTISMIVLWALFLR